MSFPDLKYDTNDLPDSKKINHQTSHVEENIFSPECGYCVYEKCYACLGSGMTKSNDLCDRCKGRGRIF